MSATGPPSDDPGLPGHPSESTPGTVRWLHAADLHLGAPLRSLGAAGGEHGAALRHAAAGAWGHLVDAAIDHRCDLVLLAGDIHDGADREPAAELRWIEGLERWSEAGIDTFVVTGNHDPTADHTPIRPLPPRVHVLPPLDPEGRASTVMIEVRGARVAVSGASFGTPHERRNLVLASARAAGRVSADLHLGLVHANLDGLPGHDAYAACSTADLHSPPIHYWALGHVHRRTVGACGPGRWWAYPGNLQGRSTAPAECGPKGALLVEARVGSPMGGTAVAHPEFLPLDGMRFERVNVSIGGAIHLGEVLDAITAELDRAAERADGRPVVARVECTGTGATHRALQRLGPEGVLARVRPPRSTTIGSVVLRTRPAVGPGGGLPVGGGLADAVQARVASLRGGGEVAPRADVDAGNPFAPEATPRAGAAAVEAAAAIEAALADLAGIAGGAAVRRVRAALAEGRLTPAAFLDRVEAIALDTLTPADGVGR